MKRLVVCALILAAFIAGLQVVGEKPAEAALANYRWKYSNVCVIDKTGPYPVDSATYRWDKVPDLRWYYNHTWCNQKVYVYDGYYGKSAWCVGRYFSWAGCAEATLYASDGKTYEWLGNAYRMYKCKIRLNKSYYYSWADKRSLIMHEMGHCSGLNHTSYYSSLMNTKRWLYYNYPTSFDKSEIEKRYPW